MAAPIAVPLFEQGVSTAAAIIAALAYRRFDRMCAAGAAPAGGLTGALCAAKAALLALEPRTALLLLAGLAAAAVVVALLVRALRKAPVYVVDFSVHKPDASWAFSRADVRRLAEKNGQIPQDMVDFMAKLAYRSGLGDNTAVTPAIQANLDHKPGMEAARSEYEATCFSVVEELLAKTGIKPSQIKFVITNSSLFNPTPSLSAAIMNRFKLRDDTINYSLGGMGCSAGVIALDLARQMLQLHPGSYALVVSHENITNNYYNGKDPSMLLPNTLFRANGAAVLLSSCPSDARAAKYTLKHVVRTNLAADDEAFGCIWQTDDEEHKTGVMLKKELIPVAGRAVARNMGRLGPLVLPVGEQLKYAANAALRAGLKALPPKAAGRLGLPAAWTAKYTPDFTKAFDQVCIHTGGRGVIDSMESNLNFPKGMMEASRAALYRFGNTSSCSVWYELAYAESVKGGLQRGARVWQLAFGSGFKVNSAVLVANRRVKDAHAAWEGFEPAEMRAALAEVDAEVAASRAKRAAEKAAAAAAAATPAN